MMQFFSATLVKDFCVFFVVVGGNGCMDSGSRSETELLLGA